MHLSDSAKQRLIRDLLADALEEIKQKDLVIKALRSEVARLNQRRNDFELSGDTLPALLRPQA